MPSRYKISQAPNGEDTSIDGTELVPVSSSKYALISSILTYIAAAASTLTNKTINLASNTLTGTKSQFNTALSDADFATLAGAENLTNKTLTTPTIASFTNATHNHEAASGGGTLDEDALALTDVTTNNSSTAKHGFLKKLSNVSTEFMNGQGNWATPAGGSGDVATDAIWDAKGDIAVGTGANTAVRLPAGTDGQVLTVDLAEASGLKWTTPGAGTNVATDTLWDVKGDLAVGTGSNTAARLAAATDGYLLSTDSGEATGLKWVASAGGGAPTTAEYLTTASDGTLSAEVVIPGLAGSADISGVGGAGVSHEFDSGASPLTWSAAIDTEDVDSTIKSHLYLDDNGAAESLGTYSWSPAGAFDIRSKLSLGLDTVGSGAIGLIVGDSAMNNRAIIIITPNASKQIVVKAYTYAASTYTQRGVDTPVGINSIYLRITRDGSNNNSFWYSSDGLMWCLIATQALTYTCAKAGVRMNAGSAVTRAAVDWIRSDV